VIVDILHSPGLITLRVRGTSEETASLRRLATLCEGCGERLSERLSEPGQTRCASCMDPL
jgi:hypothetical protein